jgi:hypothetical protein
MNHLTKQTAMEAMGLIAIIVNCYLIGQCGQLQRLFPWMSPEMTIIFIVLLEVCPSAQGFMTKQVRQSGNNKKGVFWDHSRYLGWVWINKMIHTVHDMMLYVCLQCL